MSYAIAALTLIVVAQSAALVALARGRGTARRQAQEHARQRTESHEVAHDLNNLLSVILNYASFVSEDLAENNPSWQDVAEIRRAALQAGVLAHSLNGRQAPPDDPASLRQAPRKRRAAA